MRDVQVKNFSTGDWAFVAGFAYYNVAVIVLALLALAVIQPSELYFVLTFLYLLAVYGGLCYGACRVYDNHQRLVKLKAHAEMRHKAAVVHVTRLENEAMCLQAAEEEAIRKTYVAEEATRIQAGRVYLTQACALRILTKTDTLVTLTEKGSNKFLLTVRHGVVVHQTDVDRRVVTLASMLEYRHHTNMPQDPIHPITKRHASLEQLCDAVFEVSAVTNTNTNW